MTCVPPLCSVPSAWYASAPRRRIAGIVAIVSTLLSSVGRSNAPDTAGNGGFALGWPRKPLSEASSAVSSPQM